VVPIQEKSLRFDMTIMAMMVGDGHFTVDRKYGGKCPGVLRPIFANGELMDEDMGRKLVAWIGGQDAVAPEMRRLSLEAGEIASGGVAAYREFWKGLTKPQQAHLLPQHENLKSIAVAADADAARAKAEETDAANHEDAAADPFGSATAAGPALPGGVQAPPDDAAAAALGRVA